MTKPYDWEEIKQVLLKELKDTKHILTFGTIGSLNVEHDIDIIITKKPKSKTSDFYREVHNLFDNLDKSFKKKYGARVIRFAQHEPESLKLANYKENDLAIQTLIYTNYSQIEDDWNWFIFKDENVKDILNNTNYLIGSNRDIFSKNFHKGNYYDSVFLSIYLFDRVNSHYPEKFLVKVMNKYYCHLFGKKLKLKTPVARNEKQVREIFYKLCDILDDLKNKNP